MRVEINEDEIAQAVQESTTKAVTDAMSSYEVERVIRDKCTEAVLQSAIASTVADAVTTTDLTALTTAIAAEFSRTVASAASTIMREAAIGILMNMRDIKDYASDVEKARVRAEIIKGLEESK